MKAALASGPATERRLDLDWVRIIAFGLLILYHVACFYALITPHDQALSPRKIGWLIVPMLAINPWRLLALFIVSGAATRFMANKLRPATLFRARSIRLLPPLILAVLLIVPPMGFVAVQELNGYRGGFFDYLAQYFAGGHAFCQPASPCVTTPSYGHLWFVAYLYAYTLILIGLVAAAPALLGGLQRGLERALTGWGLVLWPAAYLVAARIGLEHRFPENYSLLHDWYAHAIFGVGFLFGYLTAKSPAIWADFERLRRPLLAAALTAYALIVASAIFALGADFNWAPKVSANQGAAAPVTALVAYAGVLFGIDQWLWIAAAFGFARRHLAGRDGPVRRYLTDAIFPFYIIHMLTIAVGGHYLVQLRLPLPLEAAALVLATALSCVLTYELVRRTPWLRPWFGLKPHGTMLALSPAPAWDHAKADGHGAA